MQDDWKMECSNRKKYFEKLDKTFDDIANQYHLDSYRSSNKRKGC